MRPYEQVGVLTVAQNSEHDYLEMALLQAMSLKLYSKLPFAVIVDQATHQAVSQRHLDYIDYIIPVPTDHALEQSWKMNNEFQVGRLTPFKETIKTEADLIFTRDPAHWLEEMRHRPVCITSQVRDYRGNITTETKYRREFIENNLPNLYNGISYFRHSQEATDFFRALRFVTENWESVKQELKFVQGQFTTDMGYALAAVMTGVDCCSINFPTFTHMKPAINNFPETRTWTECFMWSLDNRGSFVINGEQQFYPVHYHAKDLDFINQYQDKLVTIRKQNGTLPRST